MEDIELNKPVDIKEIDMILFIKKKSQKINFKDKKF